MYYYIYGFIVIRGSGGGDGYRVRFNFDNRLWVVFYIKVCSGRVVCF